MPPDDSMENLLHEFDELADKIKRELGKKKREIEKKKTELEEIEMFSHYSNDHVDAFFKKPYVILPKREEEWYLIVPKFFDLNVGYLTKSTDSYNVFIVNKYADYLGAVPEDFKSVFKFKPKIPLKIFNGVLLTGDQHQDTAWERYRKFLHQREGTDRIKVKRGKQFDLIAKLIDDGILPFIPKPVEKQHLIPSEWKVEIPEIQRRREMQFFRKAVTMFLETGAVGIYWAMGVGKSIFGLELLSKVKVDDKPNLVISGSSAALREQWRENLEMIDLAAPVVVETYHSWHKVKDQKFGLTIMDECHHLPANTFSKIATINTDYRVGLSATPYREDGRTDYIFALTGFPLGLDWRVLIDLELIGEPEVTLYLCGNYRQKMDKLAELLQDTQKTLIYSFSLDVGRGLSKRFDIPFVHGDTPIKDRLSIIRSSQATIVSSVGKEGISLQDIERTITYNFLFGSRQEESQFFGRLLHGETEGTHIIMMTDDEYERYGKRIYGIQEKGFKIRISRIGGGGLSSTPAPISKPKKRSRPPARLDTPFPASHVKPQKAVIAVDSSDKYPLLDERDEFSDKMIKMILRSDYASEQRGLAISQIKAILDHSHIKYGEWYQVRNMIRTMYNNRDLGARREGSKRRYFLAEAT